MVQPSNKRFLLESDNGVPNGLATLDGAGKVPAGQLPDQSSTYVAVAQKGAASGVASLDPSAKIPAAQIPDLSASYLLSTFARFAAAPSGGNDLTVLQALVNSLGGNGGRVWLREATYLVDNTLVVPNKVTVKGQGRSATYIKASASFPINTAVVQLGPLDTDTPIHSYAFATRLEDLTVDANSIAGSTAVYAERLQEQSGLSGCVLSNFKLYGANFNTVGNADFGIERCEIYPATGATYGVYFNGSAGSNYIRECTVGVQGSLTAAVYVKSATVFAQSLHMEACTDGLVWDAGNGTFSGITGPTTAANVTNLVRMLGNSRYVSGAGITKNSSTNAVKDEFFGRTITDSYVPLWVGGDAHIARLNHVGDKLGLFGTAQVSKQTVSGPKGGDGATASLVSALAAYGLITDSTTTPLATKTSNYTITTADRFTVSNGASLTMTLPDPTTITSGQQVFVVKNINAAPATVVSAGTSKTIDGAASQSLAQWAHASYVSDGTQWLTAGVSGPYVKYVSAPTGVAATDTANIQAAINALSATGGTVILQAGLYNLTSAGLTGTGAGVTIAGQGGTAQGVSLTWGATRLVAASAAGWAITWGATGAGNANYAGLTLRDLQIVGNATATGGVWLKGQSNFRLSNVTITGYTAGTGLSCDSAGSNSQYGELIGFQATDNQVGLQVNGSNGLRVVGGMFDGNHNAGSIRAGSTAVQVLSGDTLRMYGTVIQYYETAVDLAVGLNPELYGCRFEAFTTAIKNAAPSTRIYGGSFNNSIIGLSGTAVNNLAAATGLLFDPGDITQVATGLTDAGSGTQIPRRSLASTTYNPGTAVSYSTGSTTSSDIDATNAAVTFRAPLSGRVTVNIQAVANLSSGAGVFLGVREGAADLVRKRMGLWGTSGAQVGLNASFEISGLTPGSLHTYKAGFAAIAGTPTLQAGGDWGPLSMTVHG